jgi:hypothetical protein
MSDVFHQPTVPAAVGTPPVTERYETDSGRGWVVFAGVMLLIVGVMNIIYGIAAIDNANFYVQDTKFVISDLNTWGWILVVAGVVQFIAAFSIWRGGQFGRWIGVTSASVNAIVQLLFIASNPFLSLALFSVDLLVIFGLIAYGGRRAEA